MTRIFVAGHNGMVGSAISKQLRKNEANTVVTRSRSELNLTSQADVMRFFEEEKIDQVYLAAAKVGGIVANNTYPADFIYENLMIQNNIIHAAHVSGVNDLLFLGSSCIYPKLATQPMTEHALLTGTLEPTNEPYAIAKIAGIKMCESYNRQFGRNYRSVMPSNLYGENDNFHPENSHVIPALIRRFHEAKLAGASEFDESFSTHYVAIAYKLKISAPLNQLPEKQHGQYKWFSVSELLASDAVHLHTKWYFSD